MGIRANCGPQNCDANISCTAQIAHIAVEVVDGGGAAVPLDYVAVTRIRDNKMVIENKIESQDSDGFYKLFSDNEQNETVWCGEDFEFKGYRSNRLIAKRLFKIGFNCCHVKLLEGNLKVVISK